MSYHNSRSSHTVLHAMEYLKQIRLFTTFSQFFDSNQQRNHNPVKIENAIFMLHSQCTVYILLVSTMFLSMRQHFGEPIECLSSRTDLPPTMLQNYCWLEGSFSVAGTDGKTSVGTDVAYPGVKTLNESAGERRQLHKYYQWVYFVLIIQSIMFYVPKYLWKVKESQRLKNTIFILTQRNILEFHEIESKKIIQDVFDAILLSSDYFFFFFFCEFLYYVHLIMQIWFVQIFLGGQFLRLGWDWLIYSHNNNYQDPLIRIFPRMTKCLFHKYGYSGSIESHDALCFLTLNIVNEKIYVVLWFWFAFLFVITSLGLFNRVFLVLFPSYRYFKLTRLAPSTDKKYLRHLTSRVGNWFILHHMCKNMKPSHFKDLINYLVKEHFDKDYNLVISNKDQMLLNNKMNGMSMIGMQNNKMMMQNIQMVPSAPMQTNSKKKAPKSTMKNQMYYGGRNNVKQPGFVSINRDAAFIRDPPSGQTESADSDENSAINMGYK